MCQWLLTVETEAWGGVLERLERRIWLEALREVLGGLCVEIVVPDTANERRNGVLAAADSLFEGSVAYMSEVRALFSFRPSTRCIAPSAPMLLSDKLRARARTVCQRLLTLS